jgi:hypothetical protein
MKWWDRITGKAEHDAYAAGLRSGMGIVAASAHQYMLDSAYGQLRVKRNALRDCARRWERDYLTKLPKEDS